VPVRPAAALPLLLCLAACRNPPPSHLSTDVFEDIPAPRGARYIYKKNESFSYRSPSFRCGRFLYDLHGSDAPVVRFYRDTMTAPPYNWTLTGEDRRDAGSTRLVFVKEDDRCEVDVDFVPKTPLDRPENVTVQVRVNYNG
jgi:hypothetical protein